MLSSETNTDKEWLLLIADGDEQAFRLLFEKYTSLLFSYVVNFVKSQAIAEELIQNIFIRIWMNRDKLPAIENPKAWIFKIATNECYTFLRNKEIEKKSYKVLEQRSATEQIVSTGYRELEAAIEEAIGLLPQKRRQIYQLSRTEGLKPSEIAAQLNLSVSTVKNTLVTAVEFIRQHLIKKGLLTWAFFYFF